MLTNHLGAAFRNWSAQLGIVITIAGLMSFLARTLAISPIEPLRVLIDTYRALFHPILDLPLSWLGVTLSDPVKDGILIWMAIGGAIGRTLTALYASNRIGRDFFVATRIGEIVKYFSATALRRLMNTIASLVIWPVLLFFGLQWPVVVSDGRSITILPGRPIGSESKVLCDLRVILMIQLATIGVACWC